MITDDQLDEMATALIPRLEDVARRWKEDETYQLPKPPELGEYFKPELGEYFKRRGTQLDKRRGTQLDFYLPWEQPQGNSDA